MKISYTRIIDIAFPELHKAVWSVNQASVYALLLELPSITEISTCHLTKLTNILSKASRGKYCKEKAIEIKEIAKDSIGSVNLALSFELQQTIRLIQNLQSEIDILESKIEEIMNEINSPVMTIPGISYILASIIISEIGNVDNFDSSAKLLAFAGLEPSTHQSGKYIASHSRMVKRGSKYLRWALLTASRLVSLKSETFKKYLSKKRNEGKYYFVALSHTAKKLVRVIFHLLKTGKSFA